MSLVKDILATWLVVAVIAAVGYGLSSVPRAVMDPILAAILLLALLAIFTNALLPVGRELRRAIAKWRGP